ncbi:hypothetical protein BpHYR1_033386 [Brachionus plicatilis]|uniref:Uncharacterized protein n=1 Tax=Brachionus plicatilis TaxID=10195 RepID=A0A3M7P9H2_BRAPC|nr:hypothetical protein BpHYR1_033386 [Brachionus plicatilis]
MLEKNLWPIFSLFLKTDCRNLHTKGRIDHLLKAWHTLGILNFVLIQIFSVAKVGGYGRNVGGGRRANKRRLDRHGALQRQLGKSCRRIVGKVGLGIGHEVGGRLNGHGRLAKHLGAGRAVLKGRRAKVGKAGRLRDRRVGSGRRVARRRPVVVRRRRRNVLAGPGHGW